MSQDASQDSGVEGGRDERWELHLYVAGQTRRSLLALANLKRLCEQYLAGRYQIEVIDLLRNPALAQRDQILAIPTLVKRLPEPSCKVIGDLSNTDRVLSALDIRPKESQGATNK